MRALSFLGGFTLSELAVAVVLLALVAALASRLVADRQQIQEHDKLVSDVRALNAAADVYRIFDGSLAGVTSVEGALVRLKSSPEGGSGNLIDPRLRAEMHPEDAAHRPAPTVVWNAPEERFEIQISSLPGVKSFRLDDHLASLGLASAASRGQGNLLNDRSVEGEIGESAVPGIETSANLGNAVAGTGALPAAKVLDTPVFSLPAGEYAIIDFSLNVRIKNPNSEGLSRILYSVDEGPWKTYDGSILTVGPGTKIEAFADSTDPSWTSSEKTGDVYVARGVKLNPPVIVTDAAQFDFGSKQVVQVNMEDPNQIGSSKLEYRIDGGAWQTYQEPFDLGVFNFRHHGAEIEARAISTAEHFSRSEIVKAQVREPGPEAARSSRGKNFIDMAMGISQASRQPAVPEVVSGAAPGGGS